MTLADAHHPLPPITLGELLHECADKYSERPFITIAETGATISYGEFEALTNRLARGLRSNCRQGSVYVAIMLENGIEYLAASYALKKADRVEVSINRAFRGPALARMIDLTGARVLFTSDAHLDALNQIRESIPRIQTLIVIGSTARA